VFCKLCCNTSLDVLRPLCSLKREEKFVSCTEKLLCDFSAHGTMLKLDCYFSRRKELIVNRKTKIVLMLLLVVVLVVAGVGIVLAVSPDLCPGTSTQCMVLQGMFFPSRIMGSDGQMYTYKLTKSWPWEYWKHWNLEIHWTDEQFHGRLYEFSRSSVHKTFVGPWKLWRSDDTGAGIIY
jgi:hypothetical protein